MTNTSAQFHVVGALDVLLHQIAVQIGKHCVLLVSNVRHLLDQQRQGHII